MAIDSIRWLSLPPSEFERMRAAVATTLSPHAWVAAVWFYGSAARGRPARDIDLGILAEPLPANRDFSLLAAEIADKLGFQPEDIDLRLLNGSDPVFLGNVLRDGKLAFERNRERRIEFEVWAMNQWLDFKPVWERHRRRLLAAWSHG